MMMVMMLIAQDIFYSIMSQLKYTKPSDHTVLGARTLGQCVQILLKVWIMSTFSHIM